MSLDATIISNETEAAADIVFAGLALSLGSEGDYAIFWRACIAAQCAGPGTCRQRADGSLWQVWRCRGEIVDEICEVAGFDQAVTYAPPVELESFIGASGHLTQGSYLERTYLSLSTRVKKL